MYSSSYSSPAYYTPSTPAYYTPSTPAYYTPSTPRRKRRSYSVPAAVSHTTLSSSSDKYASSYQSSTSRASSMGPSHQQKAYDNVRARYFVPQTTRPAKSQMNANNLIPPPSYRHSMSRIGEGTALRGADPYYYASRDYLARTGSYYGTYGRPKHTYTRPSSARYSQFYPDAQSDIYSPSYGLRYGNSSSRRHHRVQVGYRPIIVEAHDDLDEAKPLTTLQKAKVQPVAPPVRVVTMGKADVATDHGVDVSDIEKRAEDIYSVVSPPVRAVQIGKADLTTDDSGKVTDLVQRADSADSRISPPVRAVQMGQADVVGDHVADVIDDFDQFAEVAADLDIGVPVRAVQIGQAEVNTDQANDLVDLRNPDGGIQAQKATVIDGDSFVEKNEV